ncbi:ABC transporter permease [Arthrobacter sp. I2-34]|uniref:ABC transporter permease n=1 Tax=Arthrobacter hankyongi TaxID=2904801 RepID=A0ABS9LC97_9MICC|nr:ABC transporter permease [Arthrobacter hankyongi]MCG2624295.1 ABC transporter permease [Arthrobacter hankyongi]
MPENSTLLNTGPAVWLLLAVLLAAAAAVSRCALGMPARQLLSAGLRALLQLAVVSLAVAALSRSAVLAAGFLLLMLLVAAWTAARRIGAGTGVPAAALPILAGVAPVAGLMFATGVLPAQPLAWLAVCGQLIGGAMTATNLAGRRISAELTLRRGEVEAGLALGFEPRAARALVARPVAHEALLPALDQTRTVGTVTLPGAFVGLILGGASPLDAGLVQLIVLVSLLAVEAIAIAVLAVLTEAGQVAAAVS